MGLPPKQFHEGYWYHVYTRVIPELQLFETDEERTWFLENLDEIFVRRKVSLSALCLMDTHYHALVKMGPVRLDRALNGLHMSYAKHLNHERDRRGSVFETHPGSDIVLDDAYLLQLVSYIHNNPVEAGIVEDPQDYTWSTDQRYRTGEPGLMDFDCWEWPPNFKDAGTRSRGYREASGEPADLPRSKDGYIGTEEEWKQLEKRDDPDGNGENRTPERRDRRSKEELTKEIVEATDLTVEDLKRPGRDHDRAEVRHRAMVALYDEGYGPTEIGEYFNRHKGTVAYAIRKDDNETE